MYLTRSRIVTQENASSSTLNYREETNATHLNLQIPDEQRVGPVRSSGPQQLDIHGGDDRPPATRKTVPKYSMC